MDVLRILPGTAHTLTAEPDPLPILAETAVRFDDEDSQVKNPVPKKVFCFLDQAENSCPLKDCQYRTIANQPDRALALCSLTVMAPAFQLLWALSELLAAL